MPYVQSRERPLTQIETRVESTGWVFIVVNECAAYDKRDVRVHNQNLQFMSCLQLFAFLLTANMIIL